MKTVVVAALVLLAACGGRETETVLVSAAASLIDAFGDIEAAFEEANPQIDVVLNVGASSTLREQILAGAPADVFASANTANVDALVDVADGDPVIFARNRLQIAVPEGNPAGIGSLDDFADRDLFIGLCAQDVPCGDFARQALRSAGVAPSVDTNEPDVRALMTKIETGELDAGIVYATDVVAANVDTVDVLLDVVADYPIVAVTERGDAFVDLVLSDTGRSILRAHGFGTP